ncbi:MAG: glycogen-binding domain-containing protein [Spirochaetaceae bacterium]|jgi:hypothetical protein|nr:glycogen-binding domain-containing protein [Spirochaetaceae bacterium]
MKRQMILTLLVLIIGNIGALDTDSSQFIDHLIALTRPGPPEVIEDSETGNGVLFTFSTEYRSVGIAFAHENFTRVHHFEKLMIFEDQGPPSPSGKLPPPAYTDPKILFFAYTPPVDLRALEYRLVINGLWTHDPHNPLVRENPASGIVHSVVLLPDPPPAARLPVSRSNRHPGLSPGALYFNYSAEPGEIITVAGDFNGWDPFMYELREIAPGRYRLVLPLPPGTYRYVFFHRGERRTDPNNLNVVYDRLGSAVSEASVE